MKDLTAEQPTRRHVETCVDKLLAKWNIKEYIGISDDIVELFFSLTAHTAEDVFDLPLKDPALNKAFEHQEHIEEDEECCGYGFGCQCKECKEYSGKEEEWEEWRAILYPPRDKGTIPTEQIIHVKWVGKK